MKIAIFGESDADEAAITILVEYILRTKIERPTNQPRLRARGCTQIISDLPRIIEGLHYNSNAHGLIVVLDSNGSTVKHMHSSTHDEPDGYEEECWHLEKIYRIMDKMRRFTA